MKIWNRTSAGVAALAAAIVIAGCGESSSKSASVSTATTATTATTPSPPATTSTAAKQPSTTTSTTSPKPPPVKTSTKSSNTAQFGKIKLTSSAFKGGGPIPVRYTCYGGGVSPPLQWHPVPTGTAELFLLAIDLSGNASDAIQWAVAGIPPSATSIPAGGLPAGAIAGVNSAGKTGWGGVCGAKGKLHHVGFLLYALRHKLNLKSGFNPITARNVLKGATLGTGLTLATYQHH